jgi:hypothetical protein
VYNPRKSGSKYGAVKEELEKSWKELTRKTGVAGAGSLAQKYGGAPAFSNRRKIQTEFLAVELLLAGCCVTLSGPALSCDIALDFALSICGMIVNCVVFALSCCEMIVNCVVLHGLCVRPAWTLR